MNTKGKTHGCPPEVPPYTWDWLSTVCTHQKRDNEKKIVQSEPQQQIQSHKTADKPNE